MPRNSVLFFALALGAAAVARAEEFLPPAEAAKKVGETIVVEMEVKHSKNALERRKEIYLDSELDFNDPKNFAVVLTVAAADQMKQKGIEDPAEHFQGKTIRAKGKVTRDANDKPRIVIEDADDISIVKNK